MNSSIFALFLTFTAFIISLVGTRLLIITLRDNPLFMDVPNARSNHVTPVPRGGGLAVVMAILIPMLVADVDLYIALSILLLASISMMDDLIAVPVWVRLLVQIVAVFIPLSFINPDFLPFLSPAIEKILIGLGWIWMINLTNFMDGVDGMSAAEASAIGLSTTLIIVFADQFPNQLSYYGMIVAAAGCGFWWWNKSPARIFLGDVGSIPLGFIMGYLLLQLAIAGHVAAALILPAFYLSDSTATLLKRLCRGKKLWHAHSEHYYQKAARGGMKHNAIVRYVTGINILLGFLAVHSMMNPELDVVFVALAYMAVFMLLGFFAFESPQKDAEAKP